VVGLHGGSVDAIEGRQGGDEEDTVLSREVDRLVVDPVAVLHAGDPAANRVEDSGGALGVGCDRPAAVPCDLVHDGLDLLGGEPLVVRLVVRTSHPTGGTDLDDVCALSQESSDADAHLRDGVDQLGHAVGRIEPARRGEIAVAAGVAQHPDGGVQAGTGQQPGGHGDPEPRWQPAQVAGGGDAGVQGQAHPLGRLEGGDRGIVEEPRDERAGGLDPKMDVAVDEAGEDRSAGAVQHLHPPLLGWGAVGWPGVHDPRRFDLDDCSMQRSSPCPVDQRDVLDAERWFIAAAVHAGRFLPGSGAVGGKGIP